MKRIALANGVTLVVPNLYGPNVHLGVVREFIELERLSRPETVNPPGIKIYGDGTQTRDFVYEGDVVRAISLASTWQPGEYYIGTGVQTSVFQVFRLLTFEWGYTPKRDFEPGLMEAPLAAIESSGLPWDFVPLEQGLKLTVAGSL